MSVGAEAANGKRTKKQNKAYYVAIAFSLLWQLRRRWMDGWIGNNGKRLIRKGVALALPRAVLEQAKIVKKHHSRDYSGLPQLKSILYMYFLCFARLFAIDGGVASTSRTTSSWLLLSVLSGFVARCACGLLVKDGGCNVAWEALLLLPCFRWHAGVKEPLFVGLAAFSPGPRGGNSDGLLDRRLERAELLARLLLAGFERWLAPGHGGARASDFKGLFQ